MRDGESHGDQFEGTDRFVIKERLGQGGMGAVYEATDRARGMDVALKTLVRLDPSALLRFKQEFRSLVDVSHPNLVTLYELVSSGQEWFFTMELIRGVDLLTYLRGTPRPKVKTGETEDTVDLASGDADAESCGVEASVNIDFARVRSVMRQLVSGVRALHDRGYLHRDIKPSNVMVTDEGRVVLLDFGIIAAVSASRRSTFANELVGTPSYMAPEQVNNAASTASDWYAVGGVLYRVLTGRPPFMGTMRDVLAEKQRTPPPPARRLNASVPDDLDTLCADLLQIQPSERPRASEILRRLTARARRESTDPPAPGPGDDDATLVGRDAELAELQRCFEQAKSGAGTVALVHGESGMGKSALIRRFIRKVEADGATVLRGRCYERESVPFKAVDSLIDSLTRHLMELPADEADSVMPRDIQLLAKLFPVLNRIKAVAVPRIRSFGSPDPHQSRARAFAALRVVLARIAERRPLVLFIDDLQWGDEDSAFLLDALLRQPTPPSLLLVASYRTADAPHSPLLQQLLPRLAAGPARADIPMDALAPDSAAELAQTLLARAGAAPEMAASIARESGGHPYFIHELVRFHAAGERSADAPPSLDEVIEQRVATHDAGAQRLLRTLAVAGRPIAQRVLREAANLDRGALSPRLLTLRAAQLVRTTGLGDDDLVECYHDRIRETLARRLPAVEARHVHRSIALALKTTNNPDPEALAEHLEACGENAAAAGYLVAAGDRAAAALSFAHAASLYRRALHLGEYSGDEQRALYTRIGDALTLGGRLAAAAEYYDHAAELSEGVAATTLRLAAAQGVLWNGQLDAGQKRFDGVLRELGLRQPASTAGTIAGLLFRRGHLRLRGVGFRPKDPGNVSDRDRARVDACWSLGLGMGLVDSARAGYFGTRGVLLAMRIGDRYRAMRALCLEAGFFAAVGATGRPRALHLAERAETIGADLDDPRCRGMLHLSRGFIGFQTGHFAEGLRECEAAEEQLRTRCTGVTFEVGTAQFFSFNCLLIMGRFRELDELYHPRLAAMQERGDIYQATNIRTLISPAVYLRRGDPAAALAEIEQALNDWDQPGFHNQTFNGLNMAVLAHLYAGDPHAALASIEEHEVAFGKSLLKHIQLVRGFWHVCRAMSAAAVAATDEARAPGLLRSAARDTRRLFKEKAPWCQGLGHLTAASIAHVRGDHDGAVASLRLATEQLSSVDMKLHAAVAQYRLGHLLSGDEGASLVATATEALQALGFSDRIRSTNAIAPGYELE